MPRFLDAQEMERLIKERPLPSYTQFLDTLRSAVGARNDALIETIGTLSYQTPIGPRSYDFVRIISENIAPHDRILLIRAGIHGDEVAGPLTLMRHIPEILDYAHARNIKLVIFPLDNPSGFEFRLRYNVEGDKGSQSVGAGESSWTGNNDFMRYELEDGSIADDLGPGRTFKRWYPCSDPILKEKGINIRRPKETLMLEAALSTLPLNQITAHLDLHQDYISVSQENMALGMPGAYHYPYYCDGNPKKYDVIVREIEKLVPILRHIQIGGGQHSELPTDSSGGIVRHDGTLGDYLCRIAPIKSCVTVETTGATDAEIADKVNLIWIRGIIDLASNEPV